jgi:hypothetical protein
MEREMGEPVTVVGWLEQAEESLLTAKSLWLSLAKKERFLHEEYYEALEEELARICVDLNRLLGAAKAHHSQNRAFRRTQAAPR